MVVLGGRQFLVSEVPLQPPSGHKQNWPLKLPACRSGSTPQSIKSNRFLKLILLEHKPLLTCFGFVRRQKWLVSTEFNFRKRLHLIDCGVEGGGGLTYVLTLTGGSGPREPSSLFLFDQRRPRYTILSKTAI